MRDDTDRFRFGAERFAGQRLELVADGPDGWELVARGHRLGAMRWERGTDARWTAWSADGEWRFRWDGRWRWCFFAEDERGQPACWFVGRWIGRGGAILRPAGVAVVLRRSRQPRVWHARDPDGGMLARLTHGRDRDPPVAVDLEPPAAGLAALTMVLLTACTVVRLDHNYGTMARIGYVPVGGECSA